MQITNKTIEFNLKPLHPKQMVIAQSAAKYKTVCAGRRSGKSTFCCQHASFRALALREPIWWVAPTFRNTQAAWRELTELARQLKGHVKIYKDEFKIEYPGGGFVQVVSAAEPDNMRSIGLAGYIFDEAAYGQERVHTEVLTPALLDFDGWSILISTPNGYNWFHNQYLHGVRGKEGYESFHFTTYDNPHLKKSAIDALRDNMTEKAWRQEILAEFVADALSVFRGVKDCVYHDPETAPIPGHDYVMGVDWGRKHDYTALSVWNATERREVEIDHFSQVGFGLQFGRIRALYEKWRPGIILAEENGIGIPNVERMQDEGYPVQAFKMTSASKKPLVEAMALALEKGEVGLLDDEGANNEMLAYTEVVSLRTGNISYSAPEGGHDDYVVARMLAWHVIGEEIGDPFILEW